jgi:hypothetical protein
MNRLIFASAAALALMLTLPGTSSAQSPYGTRPGYYNPYLNQPRLSPYLDIVRGGGNPALNYYLGTLPEVERRTYQAISSGAIRRLERQQAGLEEAVEEGEVPEVGTGHPAQFVNYGGYFPITGPGGTRYGTGPVPRPSQARRTR